VRTIPNPVDTTIFHPQPSARRYDGPLTVLYAGRLHPEKGIHLLLSAFRELASRHPQLRLRLLGPAATAEGGGGDSYTQTLLRLSAGLPVEFVPPIREPAKLAQELDAAHFFCYPSLAERGESFGVAPLEAMATGLAPVVSSLDCFRDFIIDGETGLFFDHRAADAPARLAAQLESLLSSPDRARRLGAAAVAKAAEFSMRNVAARFLSDFGELLHTHSGGPHGRS
jgi:glycosyltransferase involved in cell wall biosynthesis